MPINHGSAIGGAPSSLRSTTSYTGAVYNLSERYEKKLDERFKTKSYTDAGANLNNFNWTSVNTIQVETEGVGRINAYDFSQSLGSRMGTMHEISDQINNYTLKQFYAIRETYEKLYSDDKMNERKIQRILKNINDDVLVPAIDKYRLKTWADGAGTTGVVTSAGLAVNAQGYTGAGLSTSNIVKVLLQASAMLDNMRVPMEGRMAYIGITDAVTMQLASELQYSPEYIKKGPVMGEIRQLGRVKVIAVPDSIMPAGAKIILKWKNSTADPRKLSWAQVYPHVEGYSGPVLNGLYRYDSFVLAQKANGIMVIGDSSVYPQTTPTMAAGTSGDSGKVVITSTTGTNAANIYYTIDGHNPKIADNGSSVVLGGTATSGVLKITNPSADCYIQAYATYSGKVSSGIAKYFFKASDGSVTALSYDEEVPI